MLGFNHLTDLQTVACLLSIMFIYILLKRLEFSQFLQDKNSQHIVFGCTVSLTLLWMFQTGIENNPSVHFLWLAALPLVLGFRWAIMSAAVSLTFLTALGIEPLAMFGVNFLLGCLAPIALTYGIYSFAFHKLPKNVFIYIFLCAFIPGALTIGVKMLLLGSYFYLDGIYSWQAIVDNYLVLSTLLLFPEGMFNGMTITLLIIYKPHWVYTYYEKYYLAD